MNTATLPQLLKAAHLDAPLRREMAVAVRVLNEEKGEVEFVASDETLDSYAEIIRVNGWRFNLFAKNAPFVDSHDYRTITKLLGQVFSWRIEGNQLIEGVRYSREPDTLADWAFKMVRDGFLKAVSVGFVPLKMASKWDGDKGGFLQQVTELGLNPETAAQLRSVYIEQEQIELSQCVIGANPNALARAYKAGCLNEQAIDGIAALTAAERTPTLSATDGPSNATPTPPPADVEAAHRRRAKLAFIAAVQSQL